MPDAFICIRYKSTQKKYESENSIAHTFGKYCFSVPAARFLS